MIRSGVIFISAVSLFVGGCTVDSLPALGYSVVDNLRQEQCQKAMNSDCKAKQSYDDYQRERQ